MAYKAPKTQVCSRCGREWRHGMVWACPHPKVQEVFGENICVYCCKRCRYSIPVDFCDGIKCGYTQGE